MILDRLTRCCALLVLLLVSGWSGAEQPSSRVAWTPPLKKLVDGGVPDQGRSLGLFEPEDVDACADCHGEAGDEPGRNKYPILAGQVAAYTFKQLLDYKHKSRGHRKMYRAVKSLDDAQLADLAAWYAAHPLPVMGATEPAAIEDSTLELVRRGDKKRMLPPCASCHGKWGEGAIIDVPALAGQNPEYFVRTMKDYQRGKRKNDVYGRMRLIAQALEQDEIEALAAYYATLSRPQ